MNVENNFDLAIIGSGPGGYVAAIRAAQLGMKVACVEKAELGGICLNWGCIPTKAIIKNAKVWREVQNLKIFGISSENAHFDFSQVVQRSRETAARLSKGVEFLFKKNQITVFNGAAHFRDARTLAVTSPGGEQSEINASAIIIATGARPRSIPGIAIDGKRLLSSREALVLPEVPKSMIIIGAGAIGVEFAYIFRSFGAEVTLVEMMPQILPNEDEEIVRELTRALRKQGINIFTNAMVSMVQSNQKNIEVTIESNGASKTLSAELGLMAIGVQPNSENLGLETLGVATGKGWIKVDENYQTNVPGIYAIGDVIGNPCLAHVASVEGIHAVEFIAGKKPSPVNYNAIPGCTYCQPQVASVGLTEKQAVARGLSIRVGRAAFRANGKSVAMGETDGIVKVVFDAESQILVGGHIVGPEATELLPELVLAVSNQLTFAQMKRAVHAHPTLSECLMEALNDAFGEAIHK